MKLVIFGLTVSSSWGNGHATLWRGLIRALAARGHQVVFFERDVPYYADHRDLTELPHGKLILYHSWGPIRDLAKRELAGADAGIVTSYCPDGIAATDLLLDSGAQRKVFYDLDTPVTLDQVRAAKTPAYIHPRGWRDFDFVLSYTGGPRLLEEAQTLLGARFVVPLYGHVDPDVHRPVPPQPHYRSDLSYLGTYAEDRQASLERLLVEPARALPERRFLIGGAMYPQDFPWTENIFFVRHMPPAEHPAFFSSSRMTLNVTRAAMAEMGWCPSGRLFEAAACGTPILTDTWPGLEEFFTPGSEILLARNTEEAIQALQYTDAELQQIGAAGRERVLAEHTSARRAELLEVLLESAEPTSNYQNYKIPSLKHQISNKFQ